MPKIQITTGDVAKEIDVDDVQTYLDELLPEKIKGIRVSKCNLTVINNLARFTNLVILVCSSNELTSLPSLPESLEWLRCCDNQLTALPVLPDSLEYLDCDENHLTSLPVLPDSLEWLSCCDNHLTSLPVLPDSLEWLSCCDNHLTSLPELSDSLNELDYMINPIYDIIEVLVDDADDISIVRNTINKLNRFRHLYYCLRFKLKFIQWFLRANETKIMEENHPDKITALLASGVDVLEL